MKAVEKGKVDQSMSQMLTHDSRLNTPAQNDGRTFSGLKSGPNGLPAINKRPGTNSSRTMRVSQSQKLMPRSNYSTARKNSPPPTSTNKYFKPPQLQKESEDGKWVMWVVDL